MNNEYEVPEVAPSRPEQSMGLLRVSWVSYALHAVVAFSAAWPGAQPSVVLLFVALVIDFVKRDDARGSWHAGHFSWRIRSVLWALFWYALTAPLWVFFVFPGAVAWFVVSLWFLYRIIKGVMRLGSKQAMPL